MSVDAWAGSIDCERGLSILVFGSILFGEGCPASSVGGAQGVVLFTPSQQKLQICSTERTRADSGKRIRELAVGVGGTSFIVEVRQPRDALLLLEVASTFRPDTAR